MNLCNSNNCCGCGLCELVCPKKAIKLKEVEYGFVYPNIDESKCINCGLCKRMCSFQQFLDSDNGLNTPIKCYAAQNSNEEEEKNSASGGVFFAIAKRFIEDGGLVCGAVMDINENKVNVHHIISNKIEDLKRMQGSKYLQSDIIDVINDIDIKIKNGKKILFCGTPCQNATIKQKVENNKNLFLIDIICHGVPSQKMFNDYLNINLRKNDKLCEFVFRDKTFKKGFVARKTIIHKRKKREIYKPAYLSSYYDLFLKSFIYRENCYNCPFAKDKRIADITVGDYWGIEKYHCKEEIKDKDTERVRAWSCILVNTEKGKKILQKYAEDLKLILTELENIKSGNGQLNRPSNCNKDIRKNIFSVYSKKGYANIEKIYKKNIGRLKYAILSIRYKLFKY